MTAPIRVLELRTVRGTGGGPEKTILFGAAQADPNRYLVTLCYLRPASDEQFDVDRRAEALGLDYVDVRERHGFDPSTWRALRRIVRDRHIDLVHAHDYKTNVLALGLRWRHGVRILSTVHGWFGSDTWRESLYYAVDKRALARYPRIIAVSTPLKDELVRRGTRPEIVVVIPNGIDPAAFVRRAAARPQIRRDLGLAEDDVVVGTLGRLEHQKRFDLLMEAVAALRPKFPRLRLLIAGEGTLRAELERRRRDLGLEDGCRLLGHRTDVVALHHAFDLFVQASDVEGSPNVVLEAMAMETPVVATAAGGTPDLIVDGRDGLIVPTGQPQAIAAAIERVVSDRDAACARARSARARVEREFSFAGRMSRVERIYDELMSSSPAGARQVSH